MATRRQAREWALQFLVQLDLNPEQDLDSALEAFWNQLRELERERFQDDDRIELVLNFESQDVQKAKAFEEAREFAEERVRGVLLERDALDAKIEPRLKNWSLYRLGSVERNVLRLGFWELENCPEIPAPIVINEHVDLAKFFSETKSGRFVNGLLDRYAKSLKANSPKDGETFTPH